MKRLQFFYCFVASSLLVSMSAQASLDDCVLKGDLSPRSSALLYDIYSKIAAVSVSGGKKTCVLGLGLDDEERFAKKFLSSGVVTPRERYVKQQNHIFNQNLL